MPANLIKIQEQGVDLSDQYVSVSDIEDVGIYLTGTGEEYYGYNPGTALWSWGSNGYGQLGLGNTTAISSPAQVGAATNWSAITSNYQTCYGIKKDGTLWAWGNNYSGPRGQLGLNEIASRGKSVPTQVGSLTDWKYLSPHAGGGSSVNAIKTDGTLWAWGDNFYGQLGLNDRTNRSSPTQVGTLTDWYKCATSSGCSIALKTDGTLWTWGYNYFGSLGLGDRTHRSSPVQVGSLTNWKEIGASYGPNAIKTDGTLWAWGYNPYGQLGLGDIAMRSSPTQVGSLTNWKYICATPAHIRLAVKTDGTLWAWGDNSSGQLGQNETSVIRRSSPVQIGSLTNWKNVGACLEGTMAAIKTDGTLWTWGYGYGGTFGDNTSGTPTYSMGLRSSPVQIGSLTTWVSLTGGQNNGHFVARKR